MARTRNFDDVIREKMAADPDLAQAIEAELFNADVATKVYEARMEARLTQKKLAELVGVNSLADLNQFMTDCKENEDVLRMTHTELMIEIFRLRRQLNSDQIELI